MDDHMTRQAFGSGSGRCSFKFQATITIEANSVDEARRLIDRELKGVRAPLARRIRGDVASIWFDVESEPASWQPR